MNCKYCGVNIVRVNFTMGEKWMHQPAGASFQDGMYEFCKQKVATPLYSQTEPELEYIETEPAPESGFDW